MDHVELYNCSQLDTQKAALRWESAIGSYSSVTNSSIHNGLSWGVYATASANIHFENNQIFGFKAIGANFKSIRNVTFDSNTIVSVSKRPSFVGTDGALD